MSDRYLAEGVRVLAARDPLAAAKALLDGLANQLPSARQIVARYMAEELSRDPPGDPAPGDSVGRVGAPPAGTAGSDLPSDPRQAPFGRAGAVASPAAIGNTAVAQSSLGDRRDGGRAPHFGPPGQPGSRRRRRQHLQQRSA